MPFETAVQRLQEIVRKLGTGSQSLTESLRLFEEGVALVHVADAALTDIEVRAKELMRSQAADGDSSQAAGEPA